jgi:hypothetical protein
VYSPYEPWGNPADTHAPPILPALHELSTLRADVAFDALLQAAELVDCRRAADGMDEAEGIETWPPPMEHVPAAISSPLSTPPSSPGASRVDLLEPGPAPACTNPLTNLPASAALTNQPTPTGPTSARKLKQQAGKKARQARNRQQAPNPLWAKVKPALSRIWQKPQTCKVTYSVALLPGTAGGFTGQRVQLEPHDHTAPWTLQELRDRGFRLVEWDGRCVSSETPPCMC